MSFCCLRWKRYKVFPNKDTDNQFFYYFCNRINQYVIEYVTIICNRYTSCWFLTILYLSDIDSIDSLRVSDMPDVNSVELAHVYNQSKVGLKNFDKLAEENGVLSIAGHSRALHDSVKLVWFNQTRGLRLFTPINAETLVRRYIETVIRRTFGTNDAMKLASVFL